MSKFFLSAMLLFAAVSQASEVQFKFVTPKGKAYEIKRENVDKIIRNIPEDKLDWAMKRLCLRLTQDSEGELHLKAHVKGLGGGPVLANVAYWGTKAVGYGTYGIVLWFQPHAAAEIVHVAEIVEAASNAAFAAGLAAPTA